MAETSLIEGKAIFSWNIPAVMDGDPVRFAKLLKDNNFEGVYLKAADGPIVQKTSPYGPWPKWGENIRPEMVDALRAEKIKVYLWQFLYGNNITGELNVAINQCVKFKPDGYIWDVEGDFDSKTNAVANARYITQGLRNAFPLIPQALCWWALPKNPITGTEWHPVKVAKAFLEICETAMPMMYWQGSGKDLAIKYLNNSLRLWREFTNKPIIPTGRSYTGDNGTADAESITAFADSVVGRMHDDNLTGISWWALDNAVKEPSWMTALKMIPKFDSLVYLSDEEIISRLVQGHPELFPELFP